MRTCDNCEKPVKRNSKISLCEDCKRDVRPADVISCLYSEPASDDWRAICPPQDLTWTEAYYAGREWAEDCARTFVEAPTPAELLARHSKLPGLDRIVSHGLKDAFCQGWHDYCNEKNLVE